MPPIEARRCQVCLNSPRCFEERRSHAHPRGCRRVTSWGPTPPPSPPLLQPRRRRRAPASARRSAALPLFLTWQEWRPLTARRGGRPPPGPARPRAAASGSPDRSCPAARPPLRASRPPQARQRKGDVTLRPGGVRGAAASQMETARGSEERESLPGVPPRTCASRCGSPVAFRRPGLSFPWGQIPPPGAQRLASPDPLPGVAEGSDWAAPRAAAW